MSSGRTLTKGLHHRTEARILNRIFIGEQTEYRVASEALGELMVLVPRKAEHLQTYNIGDRVAVGWTKAAQRVLPIE